MSTWGRAAQGFFDPYRRYGTTGRANQEAYDFFSGYGGGGGGGGDGESGTDIYQNYFDWMEQQQARQEQTAEREEERADTVTEYRRNQIADRTGYAGTVMVGDATQRSDATLAARMAGPSSGQGFDAERDVYEAAQAQESANRAESLRIISGEQYEVEDEFEDLRDRYNEISDPHSQAAEDLMAEMLALYGENDWMFSGQGGFQDYIAEPFNG